MSDYTHWQRIESIFHAVADDEPGPAREARIEALCGHDAHLCASVRELLDEDVHLRGDGDALDPHIGLRLGPFQVGPLIARGGMAAVYEAHRADDQFRQRVAVKIMDLRLSDPALVTQFRSERQILAALEHPGLTRLLDGGVTTLGEPYLVMEFVDGTPIDRYCDAQQLDVPARLRLFAQVCAGVDFAHRNLVLHRDLKPSNILVTANGQAKVVDFGTAALLQPDRLSTVSKAPLTPAYASPEQLMGHAVGTASDQYSLGLVLYELLAGASPFAGSHSLMAAMERALTRTTTTAPHAVVTEAAAAARRTTLARLRRTLTGDLGTIVGKALAHEPAARYASVQHLADDLARWSAGEPIAGRAPSFTYRASRFVQRHWVAVAVAAALTVALVGATVISFRQAAVAREQAARAQAQEAIAQVESSKARQMNRFLTQMMTSANPAWNNPNAPNAGSLTVRQLLDGAGATMERELGGAPAVEAEMRRTLGRTYIGLGATDQALPHLQRALALYQAQGDAFGVAFTQNLLGEYHRHRGELPKAEAFQRQAVDYIRSQGDAADPELHMMATNDLAITLAGQTQKNPEVPVLLRESIDAAEGHGIDPAGTSVVAANLALVLWRVGRLAEAETAFADAIARMNALPVPLSEKWVVVSNYSHVLETRGAYAEAERAAADAVAGAAQAFPPEHFAQLVTKGTWGRALVNIGDTARAKVVLNEALAVGRKIRPPGHTDLTSSIIGLGVVARLEGKLAESERLLRQALATTSSRPALNARTADTTGELGLTLRAAGKSKEAAAMLEQSLTLYRGAYGDDHPWTRRAMARVQGDTH